MVTNAKKPYPTTPDGRYFAVHGRLWRVSDPALDAEVRQHLVTQLMSLRRQIGVTKRRGDQHAEADARRQLDGVKRALGERGPVWWTDGAPDYNRHMIRTTPYAQWFAQLPSVVPGAVR